MVVMQAPSRGDAVLVTEIAVLRNCSNDASAGDWDRAPVFPSPIPDGIRTWIEHPPEDLIPRRAKANIQNRQFLQDGKLVDPYPANSYDMQRNRAIEVVFVEIKDGPHRDIQGWMPLRYVRPTVVMP